MKRLSLAENMKNRIKKEQKLKKMYINLTLINIFSEMERKQKIKTKPNKNM